MPSRSRRLTPAEIAGEDFVAVPDGFGFRAVLDQIFARAGVTPRIAFESSDLATIEGLVGAGLGVLVLPEHFADTSYTVGIPLAAAGAARVVGLAWRNDRTLSPPATRFRATAPYPA